jgi:hypothetical protein
MNLSSLKLTPRKLRSINKSIRRFVLKPRNSSIANRLRWIDASPSQDTSAILREWNRRAQQEALSRASASITPEYDFARQSEAEQFARARQAATHLDEHRALLQRSGVERDSMIREVTRQIMDTFAEEQRTTDRNQINLILRRRMELHTRLSQLQGR